MTISTHSFNSQSDWTITDPEYLKESGTDVEARHMGDFTNSDLTDFLPLTMDQQKSEWICGRSYFTNGTFQPKAGDEPSDGLGSLNLTVTNVANAGWYQFLRQIDTLWCGDNTTQTANGLYLDFDFEFNTIGQAHRIGCINPHYFDNANAVPPSLSLHNSQYDLRGYEEDATSRTGVNTGSSLTNNTRYYARESFTTNAMNVKLYPTDADRTNDTNVVRTSTISNIGVMRIQAVGAFVRYNAAGSVVKIYNFGGTLADWYGHQKMVTFNEVDFGAAPRWLLFSEASENTENDVHFGYRIQETDGVWSNWSADLEVESLHRVCPIQCYAFQIRAVFNTHPEVSEYAKLKGFSIKSDDETPASLDFPAVGNVVPRDTVQGNTGTFEYNAVADVRSGTRFGTDGTEFTGTLEVQRLDYEGDLDIAVEADTTYNIDVEVCE